MEGIIRQKKVTKKICRDVYPEGSSELRGRAIGFIKKLHTPGTVLTVSLINKFPGDEVKKPERLKKIAAAIEIWNKHSSVTFEIDSFGTNGDIRITFDPDEGSYSYIGQDIFSIPPEKNTMNLGWIDEDIDDGTTLHEFGHSLGLVHEHQAPDAPIEWDIYAVYAIYSGPPNNWSPHEIFTNILMRYSATQTNGTYDEKSIMHYDFPAVVARKDYPRNTTLSKEDIKWLRTNYPRHVSVPRIESHMLGKILEAVTKNQEDIESLAKAVSELSKK